MPESARAAALSAFESHGVSAPVLDCAFDSLVDAMTPMPRGERLLRFSGHEMRVDVTVRAGDQLRLSVQVNPPRRYRLDVQGRERAMGSVETDAAGAATATGVIPGITTIFVTPDDRSAPTVRTAWMQL